MTEEKQHLLSEIEQLQYENKALQMRIQFQSERKDERKKLITQYENEIRDKDALIVEMSAGKSFKESAVLDIVDRCFHCYASDFRSEAKEWAQDIMDGK